VKKMIEKEGFSPETEGQTAEAAPETNAPAEEPTPQVIAPAVARKKKRVFWRVYAAAVALFVIAAVIVNVYISARLSEYESAQPKHAAQAVFEKYFANPDFAALLEQTDYTLAEAETFENAVDYFTARTSGGQLRLTSATNTFEERRDSLVYVVKAGDVSIAKFTLVPSGQTTKHGSVLYTEDTLTLIRRERPAPPTPPPPPPVVYSEALQAEYGDYALAAAETFSKRSRLQATRAQALAYCEPGSQVAQRISSLESWANQRYDSYGFESEIADEFLELSDSAFSCRVRFNFRMKKRGQEDVIDVVDCTLYLRKNAKGQYRVFAQYNTGAVLTDEEQAQLEAAISGTA
jgi:hypothetical protein